MHQADSPISNILPCIGNSDEASMTPELIPFRFMLVIGGRGGSWFWFWFVRWYWWYSGGEEGKRDLQIHLDQTALALVSTVPEYRDGLKSGPRLRECFRQVRRSGKYLQLQEQNPLNMETTFLAHP